MLGLGVGVHELKAAVLPLIAELLGGGEQGAADQGVLAVHGLDHLHDVVLTLGVAHVELREVGHIQPVGKDRGVRVILHGTEGDKGRSIFGAVQEVAQNGVCGVGLGALGEVGHGVGGLHPVFQDELADFDRLQQVRIGTLHHHNSFSSVCVAGIPIASGAGRAFPLIIKPQPFNL